MESEYRLTQRQVSVLELVAKGLTNAEIGSVLGISAGTVKTHVSAIISALDVTNRTEAAVAFRRQSDEPDQAAPTASITWPRPVKVCALPLRDLSPPNEACGDFAVGVLEDLIDELAALPGVIVTSRASSALFPAGTAAIPDIARVLGVDAAIEGSVRRSGDRVCVTTRLIAANNALVWSRRYEQRLEETLSLQRRIASHVARELSLELGGADDSTRPRGAAEDRARDLYWEGRVFWNRRDPHGVTKAVQLFRAALEIEPSYDTAYVGLADALNHIGAYATIQPQTAFAAAKDAALRALSITPNLGSAHASVGYAALFGDWDFTEAEDRLRRAIRFAPGYSLAHGWLSLLFLVQLRFDDALDACRRAREIDPLSIPFLVHHGRILYSVGEYAKAIEILRRALDIDDRNTRANAWLALALALEGHAEEAVQASERAVTAAGRHPLMLANLGCVLGLAGRRDEALAVRDELARLETSAYVSPFYFGLIYAGCGDREDAVRELARARQERAPLLLHVPSDPAFSRLHGTSSYTQLIASLGLWPDHRT